MQQIIINLKNIHQQISALEQRYHRKPGSVKLLLVSKAQTVEKIIIATKEGEMALGENYVDEAIKKINFLNKLSLEWHFIGAIQSNKTKEIAENFLWVHSLARYKIAQRLNDQRPFNMPPLQICIQVNVSQDPKKEGIALTELENLVSQIKKLPRLELRGLMTLPTESDELSEQRKPFKILHDAYDELNSKGFKLDTLSMGMSHDFEAAIAEGATIVRIGTAIFGERI